MGAWIERSYRKLLVVCLFLFTLITFGSFHSFGIFLKPLASDLNLTRAAVSAAISISWIIHGIFAVIGGALSDRYGPRIVMMAGTFLMGLGYLLMSTCTSALQLYLYFGVIVGIGIGPTWVVTSATIAKWFSARRGLMLGIVLAGPGMGRIIVAPLSQYLISTVQLHAAYLILGLVVLLLAIPLASFVRPAPKEEAADTHHDRSPARPPGRSLDMKEALGTKPFWALFTIWLLVPLAIQMWQVHFFPHVSDQGLPEAAASLLFIFVGAGIIAGRISWGGIADRIGSFRTFALILILISVAQLVTVGASSLWAVYAVAALFGFSMGGNDPVYVKLTMEYFGAQSVGTIIGVLTLAFALSSAVGPLVAGFIVDRTKSYSMAFILAAAVVLVALIALQFLRRQPKA